MRVAHISDLHLEFRENFGLDEGIAVNQYNGTVIFPTKLKADVLIIAGDIHPTESVRLNLKEFLERHYNIPVIMVKGNHDYWYHDFNDDGVTVYTIKGKTIACTTFWTDFPPQYVGLTAGFSDFKHIGGMTLERWQKAHSDAVEGLLEADADIVVTHHAPSYQSVSPQFVGNMYNPFFVSDCDGLIEYLQPEVWIHGHVHSAWDYTIGETRILCNPLGYPKEIPGRVDIKFFDV